MNYTSKLTTSMAKIIGSIMTVAFSLVAFAYGQNCNLPLGWSPSTLADGQSKTGYAVPEATYTQSCTWSAAIVTCISWSIANINTYKYPSCIPHTRANCTTPTGANHLEYRTLYKANHNTYTQTCQQLSQSLQCLNGAFTWGITPSLYHYRQCTDQAWMQCLDVRTNNIMDHGETVVGYAGISPVLGQTCITLQRTLTCTNGTWSGNGTAGQAWLVTSCIHTWAYLGCLNVWTNATVPNGAGLTAYTYPSGICTGLVKQLACINGLRSGNGTAQQAGLYSWCSEANTNPCPNVISGTGTLAHGTYITKYTSPFAFETLGQSCSGVSVVLQCNNGLWVGWTAAYTGCQNVQSWSCKNIWNNTYVPYLQYIYGYTSSAPTASMGCESVKIPLVCGAGNARYTTGGTVISQTTLYSDCGGCVTPWNTPVSSWWTQTTYSVTWTAYPKTCSQFATVLSCNGNILNGNRQTYQYPGCIDSGWLVPGVDITINESPERSGYLIAQGSSPELSILFKNRWDTQQIGTNIPAGFLSCKRSEQNINVYNSNILQEFNIVTWGKLWVNIRIKPIFTDAVGKKTMVCTITPSLLGTTSVGDIASNNIWTWTFEVVKADRFDLALSKSVETISKNLEAAEGAKWTQALQNFLYNKIMNVLVPLIIIIGILSAILGFYKIMFSSDEKATSEWTRYIVFWVIGIIFIMSAKFIGQNIFDILWNAPNGEIKWYEIASWLYERILYPFIKFAIYLVLGAMFVILVSRVITFLFGSDADAQKKAGTLIGWNIISMLIIIGAKQIVEAIYGKQGDVVKDITNLGEIWSGVLADKNIPILYQVINYALGMASLIILVIIIIQTVKLLMKPDDPAQIKNIKNSLLYMFIGILVLGTGYLIVNFAIIN